MSKIVKDFSRREADGFAEERKCERRRDGRIDLEYKIETVLMPFAMDINKEKCVIFTVPRKDFTVYVWVPLFDRNCEPKFRLLTIEDLVDGSLKEIYVKEPFPEEAINDALRTINSIDSFELLRSIYRLCKETNHMSPQHLEEEDRAFLKAVKRAKAENEEIFHIYC